MCIACAPAFQAGLRALSFPTRRSILKCVSGVALGGAFVAEAVGPGAAWADGDVNESLSQGLEGAASGPEPTPATIFTAKNVITMERGAPSATAIAVAGKRIVAVGSLANVKAALGDRPFSIDSTFDSKIVLPGFIDQHLHPILGALTLSVEVISNEDWALPGQTVKAANSQAEYMQRLKAAEAALGEPKEWLLTWGFHELWHGKIDRDALDGLSAARPIAVWQRSCHEFYLNTAGLKALGLTEAMTKDKGPASEAVNWKE